VQLAQFDLHRFPQLLVERRQRSSIRIRRGSKIMARASATAGRWPPESWAMPRAS